MRKIPLLRIPHHLLPRIFHSLEPRDVMNLIVCSSTIRQKIVSQRVIPFRVETVSSPSIHQISFLFVDEMPCKVSFTVSTEDVDWMHCPYTVHEHQLEQQRRLASDGSQQRLLRWLKYLSAVFAVGFQMGTYELSSWNRGFLEKIMRDKMKWKEPEKQIIRQLVSHCTNFDVEEFLYLWKSIRLPRLASLHLYPAAYRDDRQLEEPRDLDDYYSIIEHFNAKFAVHKSEVIGGDYINPYLIFGLRPTAPPIGQYIRPRDPVKMFFPLEEIEIFSSLYQFACFAYTASKFLFIIFFNCTSLSIPLVISVVALGATVLISLMMLASAFRNWKYYVVDDFLSCMIFTAIASEVVGLWVCHNFVHKLTIDQK